VPWQSVLRFRARFQISELTVSGGVLDTLAAADYSFAEDVWDGDFRTRPAASALGL
jgi:hypothetical protein